MPLCCHASDDDMQMQTARYLGATKKAVLALKNYYKSELPALLPAQRPNLVFPHPTQYRSLDGCKDLQMRTIGPHGACKANMGTCDISFRMWCTCRSKPVRSPAAYRIKQGR